MITGVLQRNLPSGTVTFLFTDVEGSTKLLHKLGTERYAEKLAEHRRVVREACAAQRGVEVDTQGDAFFVAFPTARGAVEAARSITEELASGPIALRIGLHTGTPLVTEEGYVGGDVHFAARVAASAHGGQIVVSKATRALLDERYSLVDLGEHRLKDMPEPVAIFQLGERQFPPLRTISNTNLPRPASSFVGRARELSEVLARIADGARLVTLSGPGGSGKTRLALEAAATLVPEYKAGVFWVGLASLREAAFVSETIAQTLGAKEGLAEHISERELLLLLDNLEQVIEAAPELSSLLQACPNLTLLVTSRELLRVSGEVEYPVPPLASPEAVSLFCERSQLEPTEEIDELCRRLDSLPLAVELAAARTKALSPAQILERIAQRLDLLKGGRDADPRQQTLRATIAWSYELLAPEEQQLFGRLAVFAGGCTLDAAEDVADANINILQSLVEKSLLRFTNGRYWMLETIREYALEKLEASDEAIELRRTHAHHFAALAESAEPELEGPDQAAWFDRLERDHANFRAMLAWAQRTGKYELELEVVTALRFLWLTRGYLSEGRIWLKRALASPAEPGPLRAKALHSAGFMASRQGAYEEAEELLTEGVELARELGEPRLMLRILFTLAGVVSGRGDLARASELYEEGLPLARSVGDEALAVPLVNLADLALLQGDPVRASEIAQEALVVGRRLDKPVFTAMSLGNLGLALVSQGRHTEARERVEESLSLFQSLGYRDGIGSSLSVLGAVAAAEGDAEHAARLLSKAEALLEEIGSRLDGTEGALHARSLALVKAELGGERFETAWAEGRAADVEALTAAQGGALPPA
jgi:predicted ATPase/class 3 adenylate cyclase